MVTQKQVADRKRIEEVRQRSIEIMKAKGGEWFDRAEAYSKRSEVHYKETYSPLTDRAMRGFITLLSYAYTHPGCGKSLNAVSIACGFSVSYIAHAPVWLKEEIRTVLGPVVWVDPRQKTRDANFEKLRAAAFAIISTGGKPSARLICQEAGLSHSYLANASNRGIRSRIEAIVGKKLSKSKGPRATDSSTSARRRRLKVSQSLARGRDTLPADSRTQPRAAN